MATTIKGRGRLTAGRVGIAVAVLLPAGCTSGHTVRVTSDSGSPGGASTSAGLTADPRGSGSGLERSVVEGAPLSSGRTYRVSGALQDVDLVFTGPSTRVYGRTSGHRLTLSLDEEAGQHVLTVMPVANLRIFPSPEVVLEDVEDDLAAVTADAPADILTWLAARPFITAGPIEDGVELGGLTGRGFEYEVGELSDGARACGATSPTRCAATIWASGVVDYVSPGEHGRMVELDAAGQRLLVMITDGAAADDVLASLTFELWPPPEQVADTMRLPYFAPTLSSGQRYVVDKVSKGLGLVATAPADAVTASQRDELVWFGDPAQPPGLRHYYFVAVEADTAAANTDATVDPYAIAGPGGIPLWRLQRFLRALSPLPEDPIQWLAEQPYVEVVEPPRSVTVSGVVARVADVRVASDSEGIPCPDGAGVCAMPFAHASDAFPMVISSEYVTRVVDLRLGDHRVLITADLGTPGEAVLDSLCAFQIGRDASEPACASRETHD